jgi:DNA (cytosine-5)-methyltransferase 1
MHRQIGNAVPINLGFALGRELRTVLIERWHAMREDVIVIE